jgi:hypothetical protein
MGDPRVPTMRDNAQTTSRTEAPNARMDFSRFSAIERSSVLAVTLQILACIVAAVWLTAATDLLVTHLIDWVGVR